LGHLDVPVFPPVAVGHPALRLPFQGVADNHPDAVSLWDAGHDAVRRACLDTVDAIPEGRLGPMDEAVGKLAAREPRLAGAVLARLGPAWNAFPEFPASVGLAVHWALLRAEAERCTPGEGPFAA
jgi:hypothetical protein